MIQPINYTDVCVYNFVFNGTVPAGGTNVVVGPATLTWSKTIFIINMGFSFWGAKASGLSVGEAAYAFFSINGMEQNNANLISNPGIKIYYGSAHHGQTEIDIFRRVPAGQNFVMNTNLVLEANSVGDSTLELDVSLFYIVEN